MLLSPTNAWIICLAMLISNIRVESTNMITSMNNYNVSTQQLQNSNKSTVTAMNTTDKLAKNKLLSPKNNSSEICNDIKSIISSKMSVSHLKDLIESHVENIKEKNKTIVQIIQEFEEAGINFMNQPETTNGDNGIKLGSEYVRNATDLLITVKEYNTLVHAYKCLNSSEGVQFDLLSLKEIENTIGNNKHIIREFEYLFNLSLLYSEIYYTNEKASNYMDEYNNKRNIHSLENAITENENTIELIDELNSYLEEFRSLMGNQQLHENFSNPFIQHIIDKDSWKQKAEDIEKDIEQHKMYLSEEMYRILIQEKIQPAVQGVIFIVGFVGNIILLVIFARHKEMRNPSTMLILNLAIGDAFNLLINIPAFYSYYISTTWDYGDGLCKAFRFFRQLGIAVSVYSVVMISIQRFFALRQLYRRSGNTFRMSTTVKSTLIISSVWLIGALLATPHTIHAGVYNGNCYSASPKLHTYYSKFITLFDFILFSSIPVIIIIPLSLSAAHTIKINVKNGTNAKNILLSSNVLIALTVSTALSYIPLYFFMFIYAWSDVDIKQSHYIVIILVLYTLLFANCCFNPIALYIFSPKFRKYFNIYLICKKPKEVNDSVKQSSSEMESSVLDTKI